MNHLGQHSGVVDSTVVLQKADQIPAKGPSAWSLYVLPVHVWVPCGSSGFLLKSVDYP